MSKTCFLLLALSFTGCRSTNSSLDVVGGDLVRADDPIADHTVALVETGRNFDEFCSGVLIAKGVVLTAAHCFVTAKEAPMLYFGHDIPSQRKDSDARFVPFREVIIHPDFSQTRLNAYDKQIQAIRTAVRIPEPDEGLNDLAIVVFDAEHVSGFSPVAIGAKLPVKDSEQTIAAGFGCQSTDCEDYSGQLRKVSLSFNKLLANGEMLVMLAGEDKGTCAGDNGGPDFMDNNGRLELLSIASTGPKSCEDGISIETRVDPYRDWINDVIRTKGPSD